MLGLCRTITSHQRRTSNPILRNGSSPRSRDVQHCSGPSVSRSLSRSCCHHHLTTSHRIHPRQDLPANGAVIASQRRCALKKSRGSVLPSNSNSYSSWTFLPIQKQPIDSTTTATTRRCLSSKPSQHASSASFKTARSNQRSKQGNRKGRKREQTIRTGDKAVATTPKRRPILTEDGFNALAESNHSENIIANYSLNKAKNTLSAIKKKLKLKLNRTSRQEGPSHKPIFTTTYTVTIPTKVFTSLELPALLGNNHGPLQFKCTGQGKTKKASHLYAAVDTLHQLQEYGIDLESPGRTPAEVVPTHGPNGRLILTEDGFKKSEGFPNAMEEVDLTPNGVKNLLQVLQNRLYLDRQVSHDASGPQHAQQFVSTNTITIPPDLEEHMVIPLDVKRKEDTNCAQLICTGSARTKKRAEFLAVVDTLWQLHEFGIDLQNPPNLKQIRQLKEEEQRKAKVQKAQMVIELLNPTRPIFETIPDIGGGFITNVRSYYRGRPIHLEGLPASSKKASIENAWAAFADALEAPAIYDQLIESSPAQQVVPLEIPKLPFEARQLLQDVLGDDEARTTRQNLVVEAKLAWEDMQRRRSEQYNDHSSNDQSSFGKDPVLDDDQIQLINQNLIDEEQARHQRALENPDGSQGKIQSIRDALPIKDIREDLVNGLKTEQVVVVSGGTGSGKSTQCPQFILEDAIAQGNGSQTRIVVTQPRRIAAISVAERIAAERDEDIGNSVGYTVRFKRQAPRDWGGSIEFVTTGVLLRRLVNDTELEGISHVVIDEVHERDIDTDFLLVLLRDLLPKKPDLRLVLMSATLDADSFASYFSSDGASASSVPVMSVPPKPRHPVEVIHLETMAGETLPHSEYVDGEEAFEVSRFPQELQNLAKNLLEFHDQQLQRDLEEADAEEAAAMKLKVRSLAEDEGNFSSSDTDSDSEDDSDSDDGSDDDDQEAILPRRQQLRYASRAEMLRNAVSTRTSASGNPIKTSKKVGNESSINREIGEMTVSLIAKTAQHVAKEETDAGRQGSILCFLPGWDEINQAMSILDETSDPSLRDKMLVLPLHSTIPQDDQQKVFVPAESGTVKVILATNIAESSVTIDDVLAVVDSGLVREIIFDPEAVMSAMETVPISRASATQRLGRAGRVAPGKCYRLYSDGALQAMFERPTPEIQRTALEATCLNTCSMTDGKVATFLQRAMDPPKDDAISSAMDRLVALAAIDVDPTTGNESLSPLGHLLSRLPLDPATGKMLLMGCVLKCLDPVLTAAACFSSRQVFFTPLGLRKEQRIARQSLSDDSDLMASVRAYNTFQTKLREQGWGPTRQWASDNFVSIGAMNSIRSVRSQLLNELRKIGLVEKSDLANVRRKSLSLRENAPVNQNSDLESLQVSLWLTGLPDNIASRRSLGSFGTLRTRMEHHAGLHPSSVAFHRKPPVADIGTKLPQWFFYNEMILSSQVFLRGCTAIRPEQLLLFGGYSLDDTMDDGTRTKPIKVLDDWVVVKGPCDDTIDLLSSARKEIQTALLLKTMYPKNVLPVASQNILDAVCDVHEIVYLSQDGVDPSPWDDEW